MHFVGGLNSVEEICAAGKMSSYDSLSPVGGSSPILDHYEPQYYCAGQHDHENQLSNGEAVFWTTHEIDRACVDNKYQAHTADLYTGQYMGRNYAYDVLHAEYEAYTDHGGALSALSVHAQGQHVIVPGTCATADCRQGEFMLHGPQGCYERTTATVPFVRVVKRRSTANKKERRRTQSINTAFSDLRECIPNVPADTKLSKIKTLRLATSYISYLMGVLEGEAEPLGGFRAELSGAQARRGARHARGSQAESAQVPASAQTAAPAPAQLCRLEENANTGPGADSRRSKGRTGWPQHVWALELKQEQNI